VTKPVLNQIWTFLAAVLLYFSLNVWSATQQWQFTLPGNPLKEGKITAHGATLYGIPFCGILLVALLLVTRWYARSEPARSWAGRFPRLANLDFNPYSSQGRFVQALDCLVFIAVPAAAMIHFLVKFLEGTAYRPDNKAFVSGLGHLTNFVPLARSLSGGFYYDRDASVARGSDFAPFWEPWILTLWVVFILGYTVYCLNAVFLPNSFQRGSRR
jgi:hypothetical protein